MSMTYEEKKDVIDAAKVLKAYCGSMEDCEKDCIFRTGNGCYLSENYPVNWYVPKVTRWTPEDVALAKALKGFGVVKIKKDQIGNVICYDADDGAFSIIYDYIKTFDGAECNKFVKLDTIIKEALDDCKTINPEDLRPKGKWEERGEYICNSDGEPIEQIGVVFICSECGRQEYRKEPYCHCGAKMEE